MKLIFKSILLPILFSILWAQTTKGDEMEKEINVYSKQTIKEPFLVDEKNLRKLNEVIKKRLSEICKNYQIIYSVFFNDNSSYETENFEVIFSEGNYDYQKILAMKIKGVAEDPCTDNPKTNRNFYGPTINVGLASNIWPDENLEFDIVGKNRDWVSLSSSDLKQHLENMILEYTLGSNLTSLLIIILLLLPTILILFRKLWRDNENDKKKKNAEYKQRSFLSFLKIEGSFLVLLTSPIWVTILGIVFFILSDYLKKKFFPSAVFYLGEHIKIYDSIVALRHNIFWVLFITGLLSFSVSIYMFLFSKWDTKT